MVRYPCPSLKERNMKKAFSVYTSFEESERADRDYYRSLTPEQRLDILLELVDRWRQGLPNESANRLERVYRVVELS